MYGFLFHTLSRLRSAWIVRISATSPGSKTGPDTSPGSETGPGAWPRISETTSTSSVAVLAVDDAWPVTGAGQASSASSRQEATRAFSAGVLGKEESDEEAAEDALVSPAAQGVNLKGV